MSAKLAVAFAAVFFLSSCGGGGPSFNAPNLGVSRAAGFKANYMVARTALEQGNYSKAVRNYSGLLKKAGPLEPRVRLEYAHALLRAGKFDKASSEARVAAAGLDGRGRSAALAVQAVADQELARRAINRGVTTGDAIQRLVAARSSFDIVLKNHPELDPLGGLAVRRKSLDVELSTIQ